MSRATASVCAVVVAHRPEPARLRGVLDRVRDQVAEVVVVDNGPDDLVLGAGVAVLRQPANVGLAAGLNAGIAWARRQGSTHVLLLDQDSWPDPEMVQALLDASDDLAGERVAAVGPRHFDPRTGVVAPFLQVAFPMSRKLHCTSGTVRCDFLIGSGTLIALPVLDEVGEMDADLFIDNVDLDWCFRARALGYTVHGVAAARMEHLIGDRRASLAGGRVRVAHHPPARLYFIMRNRLELYRRSHTPRAWIAQDVPRVLLKLVLFGIVLGPRRANMHAMLRGLGDGLRRAMGPGPLVETGREAAAERGSAGVAAR